jgi:hypothetical protein
MLLTYTDFRDMSRDFCSQNNKKVELVPKHGRGQLYIWRSGGDTTQALERKGGEPGALLPGLVDFKDSGILADS